MNAIEGAGSPTSLLAFGQLLKRLRLAADMTQEELAEHARVSTRLISDLERGVVHRPRRETAQLLANGLQLHGTDHEVFVALARGRHAIAASGAPGASPARHGLPRPPTPIVGRARDAAAVIALLLDSATRLVTLTGPGGVGKTRLALEVAALASDAMPHDAVFVDLAPLRDPDLAPMAIAQGIGLPANPELPPRQALLDALRDRRLLLVLDNFEHVTPAASVVAELLAECSALIVLATSRMPLNIRAEREFPVDPLAVPDDGTMSSLVALAQCPAVELFLRRAEASSHVFALTPQNAAEVAAIARRLDGLPLAIELAATRVKVLSLAALLARLERRLPLLTGGSQDLPARQQTMRATIDWSYDLLTPAEQILFRRLALFAGGCTLAAAEEVGGERGDEGGQGGRCAGERTAPGDAIRDSSPPSSPLSPPSPPSTIDLLAGLVDKNLLRVHDHVSDERRYGMLETIREYGLEHLAAAGEEIEIRGRHLAWCLDLAERAEPELIRADQKLWLRRLDSEHDNMRVALGWAIERHHGELAQRLGAALHQFWIIRGHFDEGRRWMEQVLQLEAGVARTVKARSLLAFASLAHDLGDYRTVSVLEEALSLFREAGDGTGEANVLAALGRLLAVLGDRTRASALEEAALAMFRGRGDQDGIVRMLNRRGLDAYDRGDYERATTLLEEAISLGRTLGSWHTVGWAYNNLALVAGEQRDYERAMALQAEALELVHSLGDVDGVASCLENVAMFSAGQCQYARAARLFAASRALRARIAAPGRPRDRELFAEIIRDTKAQLGPVAFGIAWLEGEEMALDEAIAHVLGQDQA